MSHSKDAKAIFENGFNCAQSVLHTYGKSYFKENASAFKLASGFGAGVSYRGEMCGAVSGAIMAIGLRYGYSELSKNVSKEMVFTVTKEFMQAFEEQHGSIICNKLLKTEINTPEGLDFARKNELFKNCPIFIENACEILDGLFEKYPSK